MSIKRLHTNDRMSQAVVHNDTVYLAGQVGKPGENVTQQTETILGQVDSLLAECGSDKTKVLQAVIWLSDMSYFAEMNAVWDAWMPEGHAPTRACGESKLARPDLKVEIIKGTPPVNRAIPLDISRAGTALGWKPEYSLPDAFADYIADMKAQIG